jgi:type III pantothenate kinase
MLLAIDVGNTNIVIGTFEGDRLAADWRIRTERDTRWKSWACYAQPVPVPSLDLAANLGRHHQLRGAAQAEHLEGFCSKYLRVQPLFVAPASKPACPLLRQSERVGADRIVNAVAAYEKYKRALIIVDFGTATTFDYISPAGEYMAGPRPRPDHSSEALFQKANSCPGGNLRPAQKSCRQGHHFQHERGTGLRYTVWWTGWSGASGRRLARSLVVATGGPASLIAHDSDTIDEVIPTDPGRLRLINLRNQTQRDD